MQLRRPTRFVLGIGILSSCFFRRIFWTARTLHEASEAISLFSNPLFSKVSIKICCAASSCGAMVVADTKAANSSGLEKRKKEVRQFCLCQVLPGTSHTSHRPTRPTILKKRLLLYLWLGLTTFLVPIHTRCLHMVCTS
jgi:hypothetical protein